MASSTSSGKDPLDQNRTASSAVDRDGDGDIDRNDLAAGRHSRLDRDRDGLDRDGDGLDRDRGVTRTTTAERVDRPVVTDAPARSIMDENDGTPRDWTNKPSLRDLGLLLLRLFALVMVLHGFHKATGYSGFQASVAKNPYGAMAPGLFALMVVAGQLLLPLAVAAGFMTRIAAALQSFMMFMIWLLWSVLGPKSAQNPGGLFDPRTGGINNESAFVWALMLLPLVFTGAGRLSLDQILGRNRRSKLEANSRV